MISETGQLIRDFLMLDGVSKIQIAKKLGVWEDRFIHMNAYKTDQEIFVSIAKKKKLPELRELMMSLNSSDD